jgi:hypothetical protein
MVISNTARASNIKVFSQESREEAPREREGTATVTTPLLITTLYMLSTLTHIIESSQQLPVGDMWADHFYGWVN